MTGVEGLAFGPSLSLGLSAVAAPFIDGAVGLGVDAGPTEALTLVEEGCGVKGLF